MDVPSHNAPGFNHTPPSYSETRWRIEDSPSAEINRGQCLPSCHVPKPTTGQISPSPPCAGNTCAQKLSASDCYQGWENMQREEYMWPDTVGDPRAFQGCSMHFSERSVCAHSAYKWRKCQGGVRTTPNQSGGPSQSLSYCWLAFLPSLVYIRLKWNSWPHSHMLGKPSTNWVTFPTQFSRHLKQYRF